MSDESTALEPRAPGSGIAQNVGLVAHVLTGSARGTSKLVGKHLTIGKAPGNDLVLRDRTVSRRHCELVRGPDGVRVRDLGSTNGTRINGTLVRDGILTPGATLRVGQVDIALRPTAQPIEVLPSERTRFGDAIGASLAMRTLFGVLEYMAPSPATVLLEGETGTGKDLLARAIVAEGRRKKAPFVVVDCGGVTASLIESELFGHEKGAFTGAVAARRGAFAQADGGTIFLDQVGELPLDLQPKLLRVLETREVKRIGGSKFQKVDVRVIAATRVPLLARVAEGTFREDLYFRLAVVPLQVPPLRARREDIPLLVAAMLEKLGAKNLRVTDEAMSALLARDWPGNVRELGNVVERGVLLAQAHGELTAAHLAPSLSVEPSFRFDAAMTYTETMASFERAYTQWLVSQHGSVEAVAARMGVDLERLLELLNDSRDDPTPPASSRLLK